MNKLGKVLMTLFFIAASDFTFANPTDLIAPDLNDLPLNLPDPCIELCDKNRYIPCSKMEINLSTLDK
ncbi:hypothetical protein QE197_16785 [Arsenophonus nasoniae]|uniref:Uncharacterized protein n=1 Tax=Arsenophonus nasoniae TaxID=638 RepID=D2TWL3_9GAMM|nr:hypothetical protein [Arsenophonus nasoniae]QBY45217.1 hypothetical protein ArsFIN_38140 [Arsenophonus nasoniae]WGM01215.1 hypothetical protein QE210_15545 [Arsenophonus nasoniae]WGM05401.1 hypothetical protein QE258_18160 [Arsenophonus nasoniae]WGM10409.1 hypothetical protein QE197_16785 [Arsenophonus nasoniae]WGM15120.1 hypothetical protein QE193_16675 [Arsenophonus nasoniae]